MYDNHSNDNSRELARDLGFEVHLFGTPGELNDREYLKIKNNCWKNNTDDWVIVCDADEFVYKPGMRYLLSEATKSGKTMFKTQGFNVFSEKLPVNDIMEIKMGLQDNNYSKKLIFNPKEIREINYVYGCHVAKPQGNIIETDEILTVFHYRNIGGPERLIDRHTLYCARMSQFNINLGLGSHYLYDNERRMNDWRNDFLNSKEFSFHK